jgi:hypothetical protein
MKIVASTSAWIHVLESYQGASIAMRTQFDCIVFSFLILVQSAGYRIGRVQYTEKIWLLIKEEETSLWSKSLPWTGGPNMCMFWADCCRPDWWWPRQHSEGYVYSGTALQIAILDGVFDCVLVLCAKIVSFHSRNQCSRLFKCIPRN